MKGIKGFTITVAVLLALTACESTGIGNRSTAAINRALDRLGVDRGEEVNSVANFRLTGWHDVNDSYLIVTAGLHDHYLLSLAMPCIGLDFAFGIAFDQRTGALSRGDYVVVNALHRRGRERCQIMEITHLVDREGSDE